MGLPRLGYTVLEDRDIKSSDKCCEPNCDNDVTSKLNVCCSCGKLFCSDHWQAADFIRSEDITGKYSEYFKLERRVPKKITEYTFEPYDKGERIGEMVQKMHGIFVCGKCFEDITGDIKTTPNYKFSDGNVVYDSFSDFGGDVVSSIFGQDYMKGIISTAGLAFGIGVILLGVLAFPPVLVIAVLLIIIGLMADEQ